MGVAVEAGSSTCNVASSTSAPYSALMVTVAAPAPGAVVIVKSALDDPSAMVMLSGTVATNSLLLDLGGGSGGVAIGVTEKCTHIHATVAELPEVVAITQCFIAEAETKDRLSVMSGDFLKESINGSFEVVVMKNIIQVLSKDDAQTALRNVIKVVEPGGDLHISGRVMDDSHLTPRGALNGNMVFLNIYDGGQVYTEQLHRDWLTEAGFDPIERTVLSGGRSIIVAHKPS